MLGIILMITGCSTLPNDTQRHVVDTSYRCKWLKGDMQYLLRERGVAPTNHFFVGAIRVNKGELAEALVYWKEKRTLCLYYARDDYEGYRDRSYESWWSTWPLNSGTIDPGETSDACGRGAPLQLDYWAKCVAECLQKGQVYTFVAGEH
jgi:hypothetical protein